MNPMSGAGAAPAAVPRSDTESHVDLARRLAPGTRVAGRYRILSQVGIGGMGVVYQARDEELDTDIALKVLRPDLGGDPEWVQRLRRELVLARQVTHRNVVRIHDIGESDGLRFLTMGFVEGRSLGELLGEGPLPLARALRVFRQVAEGLQAAHAAGIVHRDLKPGNILIGPDDTAYVTDFGIARSLGGGSLTAAGIVVGTLDYLSPEQAAGDPVDARSDLYALGILLFEMLTGELPFQADSRAEALAQRITARPRDIARSATPVPAQVRRVLRRCLERNPARRYQDAGELLADLDRGASPLDRLPRRGALLLFAAALAAGSGVAYQISRARPAPAPASAARPATSAAPTGLAVLPLRDETSDEALAWSSAGVAEMLAAALAEAPQLRVLDPARVRRTLRDLRLGTIADPGDLKRLGELLDVGLLVTGSIRRAGGTLRVDLRLVSVAGESLPPRAVSGETREDGLFELVADLGERLRRELRVTPDKDRAPQQPQSLPLVAARAHREGRERLMLGDAPQAAAAFERAVKAAPGFAAAWLDLAEADDQMGRREQAAAAAQNAVEALGPADTRLALLRGDAAAAERGYAELARRYPNDAEALLELAAAQAGQGALVPAAVTLQRATELDKTDPRGWFQLGRNMILRGDARRALADPLVRALALMTQLGNERGQADVLNAMGVAHQRLGEYPQAVTRYGEAASLRRRIGDERGAALSLKNRGSLYVALARYAEASADLRAAQDSYTKLADNKGLADVFNDLGGLHEARGEYALARKAYQQALRLRGELGNDQQLAQSYDNVGYIFFLEGELDNANVYWRQALELRRKIGDKRGIVLSTQNLGFLRTAQGRWGEAMKSFLDALEKSREIDLTNAAAVSHGNIGQLHQNEGRYAAALASYADALKILAQLDDKRGLTEFTIKQAHALLELGQLDAASQKLAAASEWVRATGNREQASDLELALAEWHLAQGQPTAASVRLAQAESLAASSHSRGALLRARIARAGSQAASGDASAAASSLVALAAETDALGDVLLQIRAAEALARAELARGRPGPAADWARRALKSAERCGWAGLYRLHALLGRIHEARGDAAATAASYREGAKAIARLRDGLAPELRASFAGVADVRLIASWLEAHPQTAQAGPR